MANHKQDHCNVANCDRSHKAHGFCNMHYMQNRKAALLEDHEIDQKEYPAEWYESYWSWVKKELRL